MIVSSQLPAIPGNFGYNVRLHMNLNEEDFSIFFEIDYLIKIATERPKLGYVLECTLDDREMEFEVHKNVFGMDLNIYQPKNNYRPGEVSESLSLHLKANGLASLPGFLSIYNHLCSLIRTAGSSPAGLSESLVSRWKCENCDW